MTELPRFITPHAGAEWLRRNLAAKNAKSSREPRTISPLGVVVADVLGHVFAGLYHLSPGALERAEWNNEHYIRVRVGRHLATFDMGELTWLVVICHDLLLRLEIDPAGPLGLSLGFSQRRAREGGFAKRMPTIEAQILAIRSGYTLELPEEPTT